MPLILGTNSIKDTGYDVANSLRFNIGSTDYLNRTSGTSSNTNVWSLSMWIKRVKLDGGTSQKVFSAGSGSTDRTEIYFYNDKLNIYRNISGSEINIDTSMVFRDLSSWYHTLWVWNGTTITLYVNGASVTLSATNLGTNKINGSSTVHRIGIQHDNSSQNFGGYLAEVTFLDSTAVSDATSFGEFDSDSPTIWKPIDVSGLTFGNNGFYLDFEDSSALGNDAAGSNNFTVNNLTAIDQSTDTCTNNFATLNPLIPQAELTYSEGNCIATDSGTGGNSRTALSTIAPSSGKWYAEFKLITDGGDYPNIGIWSTEVAYVVTDNVGKPDDTYAWNNASSGRVFSNNTTIGSTGVGTYAEGNIVQIALDLDNNYIYFGVNGTYITSGDPTSGASGTGGFAIASGLSYYFATTTNTNGAWGANFGGSPPYTISSGNTDGNGYGNFEYAVPSGYYSLNTKNLAEYG